ncbi:hypothetical protein PPL_06862 [Heterostelium album PN500]|uniref:Uncharacterized protein n=1 Tax=Heterostelium pallidum (strain ATCC 26659 / Pp 5 / PN500) TaxID=670386 RepID=D3BDR0_HETP5|nr:hypothetical protein PPL_06862 [Heterostelium album PN500]EFA80041.1 hypothetical protein PPL_06862 [Heterostelium album PN500]|eukprot:XP_020432161.1 hypothetical protein PPL_06862 [Heterostelium album PN500]
MKSSMNEDIQTELIIKKTFDIVKSYLHSFFEILSNIKGELVENNNKLESKSLKCLFSDPNVLT